MYAVVTTGGKQYRVEPGTTLSVEKLAIEPGGAVTFDRVLLVGDGDETTVGTPTVNGASVSGTVLGEELGPKIVILKFKQKVKYRRHTGHRQHLTRVHIDEITANGRSAKVEAEEAAKPARRGAAKKAEAAADTVAPTATDATTAADAPDATPAPKAPVRPRRSRAAASASEATTADATESIEAKKAAPKRTPARRAAPRKKAEPEE
jgi:large subunit ribosomal protein L21